MKFFVHFAEPLRALRAILRSARTQRETLALLSFEQNVQVSDTTGDDSSNGAGYIITLTLLRAIPSNPLIRVLKKRLLKLLIIKRKNEQQCPNHEIRHDLLNGCEFRRVKDDQLTERDAH